MKFAPIQLIVVGFETIDRFEGKIMRELEELQQRGIIRVLDLLLVVKDKSGNLMSFEDSSVSASEAQELGTLLGRMVGLLERPPVTLEASSLAVADHDYGITAEDLQTVTSEIEPGTATGLLLVEHKWAAGFRDAVAAAGGHLMAQGFLTPEALLIVGQELQVVVEAQAAIEAAEAVKGHAILDALATVAAAETVKEAAIEEAAEMVVAAELVKTAVAADVIQTLIEASLIEEAATEHILETLVIAGLIEAGVLEQATAFAAQTGGSAADAV